MNLKHFPQKKITVIAAGVVLAAALCLALFFLTRDIDHLRTLITGILEKIQTLPFAYPLVCLLYLLSGFIMFPIIALNLATAMVFGAVRGFIYAISGTMLSATVFFFIGRFGRERGLKRFMKGPRIEAIDQKLQGAGILGVAVLRMIPMAPFGIFNMAGGLTSLRYIDYIAGTFLAFWPGGLARAFVGDSLLGLFLHPSLKTAAYLGCGVLIWIAIVISLHFGLKKFRRKEAQPSA